MSLIQNKNKKLFDTLSFQQEFNSILLFISELCEVPYAFVSLNDTHVQNIVAKIGFDFLTIPKEILLFNELIIKNNEVSIVPDINLDKRYSQELKNSSSFSFTSFAGFPLRIDDSFVSGTLCIMDTKAKELSNVQLKTLEYAVQQIQSLLKLRQQNKELQAVVKQQENQFQLIVDNSKEIIYEINSEGIITYASKNWTLLLGHELNEVIGKRNLTFIHPEDVEKCITFLNAITKMGATFDDLTYRILHKDGHYVWHASSLKLLEKDGERIFVGNCRDITEYTKSKHKLLVQKEFYETILYRLPTDVAVFDSNYKYTYLNPAAIKNDELRKFIIGKDDFEYAKHTKRDDTFAKSRRVKFNEALASKELIEWEDSILHHNGQTTYHTRKFNPVFREDGKLEMMIGFGVDITESKKIQEEILKNRQLTNSIIQNVAVGILVQGPQSEILENNKAACEMLGLTEDQLLGKTSFDEYWKVINLDGSPFKSEDHPVPQAIQKLKPVNNVIMGVHRPTHYDLVWLLVDAIPVFGDAGELLYVICSFNDITAQKNAEEKLKVSNERFSYSSEATSDAIWDWNMITDKIYVGASYSILFGHQFKDNIITALECENFVHPEDRASYFEKIEKAIEGTIYKWSDEYRYLKSDGSYAYVNDKAIIIRNEEGKAIRMIGAMQDITLEKKLKDQLQQSEEQFKGAFDYSAVGMALVDINGYYIEVNDRLCKMFGYSNQEMKSLSFQEITFPDDLNEDLIAKEKLDSGKISNFSSEKRFIHKNKSIVWAHMSISLAKNIKNEIKHYIVQIIDITKRKKIEQENRLLIEENNRNKNIQLNEAKNMYRLLAENTVDLVCLHNLDTSFQYVSPSIKKLLGYTPEELIGESPLDYVHPEDLERVQNGYLDFVAEKEDVSVEARFINRTGEYIWLEIKANLVKEDGVIVSFQSSTRDISQQKEVKEAMAKALIQERELNELRTNLVSTISHEFRTPMTTIRTSAELINMYIEGHHFENTPRLQKRINTITEEIDRIVELMNAVLTISKDDSGKTNFNPVQFDLKQLCLDVIETSYSSQADNRKVKTTFEGKTFTVFGDKNLMEYSLFNLLNNAFKYSDNSGDIILTLSATPSEITIQIIDFGIGIPEKDLPNLFNTFYRASNTNGIQGTGLGLYIVKTFTEKNSGKIKVESQLGQGTKVTLQFPLSK